MSRQLVSSGSPYEPITGFSRAVRIGPWISVAGTAPLRDGVTVHHGDVYGQTKQCLTTIVAAVTEAGGSVDAIVRTRVMLTDIDAWRDAARANAREVYGVPEGMALVHGYIPPIKPDRYVHTNVALEFCVETIGGM